MPTFNKTTAKDVKKRKPRVQREEELDYKSIPGIIYLENDADLYNWEVFGKLPKQKKRR